MTMPWRHSGPSTTSISRSACPAPCWRSTSTAGRAGHTSKIERGAHTSLAEHNFLCRRVRFTGVVVIPHLYDPTMKLSELRSSMGEYATRFDPGRVHASDAARVVEDAAAIKHMAATVEALAAARLAELCETADAARRGELSPQQVAVITDAATANPDAEARLLEQSRTASLGELRDECARTKANASDLEERR